MVGQHNERQTLQRCPPVNGSWWDAPAKRARMTHFRSSCLTTTRVPSFSLLHIIRSISLLSTHTFTSRFHRRKTTKTPKAC